MTAIPHNLLDQAPAHDPPRGVLARYVFSTDHKIVGTQFLILGIAFIILGGLLSLVIRWQLAWPENPALGLDGKPLPWLGQKLGWTGGKMPPQFYYMSFTMHASIMIFFAIIPLVVGWIGNYVVPLQIGARDMRFPFLNGLSFWATLPAGAVMVGSFFLQSGAAATGWTAYPPLSAIVDGGQSAWPAVAAIPLWASFFLCFLFVCYQKLHLGDRFFDGILSIAVCAMLATYAARYTQRIAFNGQASWFFSIILLGAATLMGAINYITTIVTMRCTGMRFFRMPLTTWSILITAILILLATPVLAAALSLNLMDHHRLTSFFLPGNWIRSQSLVTADGGWAPTSGQSILHQHLFWFYSHPAVYIMILPMMGAASDVISTFSRKPVFGYRPMVFAIIAIAFLGFIVWAHHMFQSGMNPKWGTAFAMATMLIAVPSGVKTFNWLGTMWRGSIRFEPPMLFAAGFVSMFVIGGISGLFTASQAVDVHIHDTYFIVAHIHYVLFGGSVMGLFMAVYYWYPKVFGRMMSRKLGIAHFALTFVCMNLVFFPMHFLGMHGMPRRVHDYTGYEMYAKFVGLNRFMTYAAIVLVSSQAIVLLNFIGSWFLGKRAGANPWRANSLEWSVGSPPPHGNFEREPVVHRGAYEYSSPLLEDDYLPQDRDLNEDRTASVL